MKKEAILTNQALLAQSEITEPKVMEEINDLRAQFGIDRIMGATSMLDLIQKELHIRPHAMAS